MNEAFVQALWMMDRDKGGCSVEGDFTKGTEVLGDETHARNIAADKVGKNLQKELVGEVLKSGHCKLLVDGCRIGKIFKSGKAG